MSADEPTPTTRWITVDARRIAVHEWVPVDETGAPLLCLGSTGLSGMQWRRLAAWAWARGHRVVAPDLIGYGRSDGWAGPGGFHVERDLEVVQAVLGSIEPPVHLVGHSYGGRMGLGAAIVEPARVRSIAVFEPTCFGVLYSTGHAAGMAELDALVADERFLDDALGGTEAWLELFIDYWGGRGSWAALDPGARRMWLRSPRKVFEEVRETALDRLPHTAYVEALGHLPLLTMSGATSTVAGRAISRILAEVWPDGRARHLELPRVGHMAPILVSRDVAAPIVEFITQADRSSRRS